MREIVLTRQNLSKLTAAQYRECISAIAEEESYRLEVSDNLPHNQKIHEQNIWDLATNYAANLVYRVPVTEEILKFKDRATEEILKKKRDNNWYFGENVLRNIQRYGDPKFFGDTVIRVPDHYKAPWQNNVMEITTGRQVERPQDVLANVPWALPRAG